jgi:hypothetical protein
MMSLLPFLSFPFFFPPHFPFPCSRYVQLKELRSVVQHDRGTLFAWQASVQDRVSGNTQDINEIRRAVEAVSGPLSLKSPARSPGPQYLASRANQIIFVSYAEDAGFKAMSAQLDPASDASFLASPAPPMPLSSRLFAEMSTRSQSTPLAPPQDQAVSQGYTQSPQRTLAPGSFHEASESAGASLSAHEGSELAAKIAENQAHIAENQARVAETQAHVAEHKAQIAKNQAELAALTGTVEDLAAKVTSSSDLAKTAEGTACGALEAVESVIKKVSYNQ